MSVPTQASEILQILSPGVPGTEPWVARHGDALVCVRQRLDPQTGRRFTTVELVADELSSVPAESTEAVDELAVTGHVAQAAPESSSVEHDDDWVFIKVGLSERQLKRRVQLAGGLWDDQARAWKLRRSQVHHLGLQARLQA